MKSAITVSQLNMYIKDMFANNKLLYNVMVKGEISNFKESHGNYYFAIKDSSSQIQAMLFANKYSNIELATMLKNISDGVEVVVEGRVASYEKTGTYAIYVNKIEKSGIGEYFISLNKLKEKLYDMGMFDECYKKPIPKYSQNIGVVTAKNGAAIRDIEKTIRNKNPYAKIYLYPALVQGDNAYKTIVDGIMMLDKLGLDVLIIGRGGGSIEDLYCFNDERVAYAIFNANTPIISAVGHEINDSISDLVADARCATPTAAGELATFSYYDFEDEINQYYESIKTVIDDKISYAKEKIDNSRRMIELLSPIAKINNYKNEIKNKKTIFANLMNNNIEAHKYKISMYINKLKLLNPLEKLEKGYAYISNKNGQKLSSIKNVKKDDMINISFKDGKAYAKVDSISKYKI